MSVDGGRGEKDTRVSSEACNASNSTREVGGIWYCKVGEYPPLVERLQRELQGVRQERDEALDRLKDLER